MSPQPEGFILSLQEEHTEQVGVPIVRPFGIVRTHPRISYLIFAALAPQSREPIPQAGLVRTLADAVWPSTCRTGAVQ